MADKQVSVSTEYNYCSLFEKQRMRNIMANIEYKLEIKYITIIHKGVMF